MESKIDIEIWFEEQKNKLSIEVKEIPLHETSDWKVVHKDGKPSHIAHESGKYHRGVFLEAWDIARAKWIERFLLSPIPPEDGERLYGVALIARYKDRYLIQAKSEPGNSTPGHVQLTSTIHASYNNIKMKLSGEVPFTWMYDDPDCKQFIISQDGAQLYMKDNKVCFLELKEKIENIPENFIWLTLGEINYFSKKGLISEHVMQCLGASVLSSI